MGVDSPAQVRRTWVPFVISWFLVVVLLVGWTATGAPRPGRQLPVTTSDLGALRLVDGLWGVRPQGGLTEIDSLVPVAQWRGLGTAYSNSADVEVAIWVGYGERPQPDDIYTATVHPIEGTSAVVWRLQDPQETPAVAMVVPITGRRHLGVVVWGSGPTGIPDDVAQVFSELYLLIAAEWQLPLPDAT